MNCSKRRIAQIYRHRAGLGLLAGAFAASLFYARESWRAATGETLSWLVLELLAAVAVFRFWCRTRRPNRSGWNHAAAYGVLACGSILLFQLPSGTWIQPLLVLCAATAAALYLENLRGLAATVPWSIACLVIPFRDQWTLWISYPLRRCTADGCVKLLNLCGIDAVNHGTTIQSGRFAIAITGYCSGIGQLEAMLLIAWILAVLMQKSIASRTLQTLFFLPAILLANLFRLLTVVLLSRHYGADVLSGTWHDALGYVQLGVAVLILFLFGKALDWSLSTRRTEVEP